MLLEKTLERSGRAFLLEGSATNSVNIPALKIIDHFEFLIDIFRSFLQFSSLSSVMCSGLAHSGSTGHYGRHSLHLTMHHATSSFDLTHLSLRFLTSVLNMLLLSLLLAVSVIGQFRVSSTPFSNIIRAFQQHF